MPEVPYLLDAQITVGVFGMVHTKFPYTMGVSKAGNAQDRTQLGRDD